MKKILLLSTFVLLSTISFSQTATSTDTLFNGFKSPGNAARPRVWWHWMNGNITKDGIKKDLLWMHRSGIGGFQNFDAAMMTPQVVEKRLIYMTPEWKEAFRLTAHLADSLKLEMAIAGSPGWSETGGPWVKAEDGMKKLVWTETFVKGGSSAIKVPAPPGTTGPFQNLSLQAGFDGPPTQEPPSLYKDIAVIVYKLPASEMPLSELKPKISSSAGSFSLSQLTDGDVNKTNLLPRDDANGSAWILFEFNAPVAIKALTIVGGGDRGPFQLYGELKDTRWIEVSDDGKTFKQLTYIPASNLLQQTISFAPIKGKYFRVSFKNPPPAMNFGAMFGGAGESKPPAGTEVAEIVLYTSNRINWAEEKSAFAPAMQLDSRITPKADDAIAATEVIDLTSKLNPDGTLNWNAPAGNWNILRFGYSLIGKTNHPASPEATGLEVDKLDPEAITRYFTTYLDQYKDATGGLMGVKGLQFVITDSWEAGAQNWTPKMAEEFRKRRGYDLLPWLPVLTGRIIKDTETSERFLFDFRQTLSEMVAEYHYDGLTDILKTYGMKRYSESHEDRRAMIADGMDVKRTAAIPMSAMWTPNMFMNQGNLLKFEADIRESASVAHIYGQNIAAAESLTALGFPNTAWSYSPEILKPTADLELASGLNRFVIHTSVHQPVDDKIPGLGLGPFGQWFNRHDTWSGYAKAWTDYLSRSSYMLQQGKFVADVLIYYGEDNNITSLYGAKLPEVPEGYAYDFINPHALITLLSVKDGKLTTPSGMQYSVLLIDENAKRMTLPVLRKITELVKAGAKISGVRPETTPSLKDDAGEFKRLVSEVWNSNNPNVLTGKSLGDVLKESKIDPDFVYAKPGDGIKLLYVHRTLPGMEIYWVNNRTTSPQEIEAFFRVIGKVPEIWHPETGITEPASYKIENGVTKVSLNMTPSDAFFVVFKISAGSSDSFVVPSAEETVRSNVSGQWTISFQTNRGAPASITANELKSLTENTDPGVKYFSGTATYTKTIDIDKTWLKKGEELFIDLGEVKDVAEVIVNGKSIAVVWKKPFRVNITNAVKSGQNKVEIKVTNLWVNRLIGDAQPGVTNKVTFTTMPFYQANSPLLPSGLLGPVQIISVKQ